LNPSQQKILFAFIKTRNNRRRKMKLVWIKQLGLLLALCFLVSCQQDLAPTVNGNPELELQVSTSVLILYNDSTPASLQALPSLEADSSVKQTPQVRPGSLLRPGLAEPFKNEKHDKKNSNLSAGLASAEAPVYSYTDAAQVYAIMLNNLIGRYQGLTVIRKGVSAYQAGEANTHLRTFYIGSTYGEAVPQALITDSLAGAPVTWINFQIWNVVPFSNATNAPLSPLGFSFTGLIGAYQPADYNATYNKIDYRGFTFNKYLAPMEMGEVKLERPDVVVHAWAKNAAGRQIPYALQSGNFWYISDNPFSYIHETDRYVVFADLIGPMLGHNETCEPRAIGRMEDLSPNDVGADLKRMLDIIKKVNIPFAAATIPLYKNNTTGVTRTWQSNSSAWLQLLRIPGMKGRIFQHGYTHQYETLNNPFGETGDDFEFWQAADNGNGGFTYIGPIPGQTAASALQRVTTGRSTLSSLGTLFTSLKPVGWVTPHYAANPDFYTSFNTVYPRVMERRLYRVGNIVAGQFFPYPVKDVYGTLILPETLGSVQSGYLIDRVMAAARANRALRCPWAGHFFHPYTIAPDWVGGDNYITPAQFEQLLRDIQALGYRYVDPVSVVQQ
jgi:uncharacterized protein YdaL